MNQPSLIITISTCAWLLSGACGQEFIASGSASSSVSGADADESGTKSNVWILVPSNINISDARLLGSGNFNLWKLDTSLLGDMDAFASDPDNSDQSSSDSPPEENSRKARKLNLFRKPWSKPKQGQLFLANGTVCRYVNNMPTPVCTFISTPGLAQPNRQGMFWGGNNMMNNNMNPNNMNNMNPNNMNMNNPNNMNNQNLNNMNNNPNNMNNNNGFNNRQLNNQGFNNQGGGFNQGNNNQQFRPMAVLDNDSTEVNVEATESASSNSSSPGSSTSGQSTITNTQVSSRQPVNFVQMTRPMGLYGRRPLNLLPFRRPLNTHYQMVPGRRLQV